MPSSRPLIATGRTAPLISRVQICRDLTPEIAGVSIPCRVSAGVLDSEPRIAVLGVYVPSRDRSEAKTDTETGFISSLIKAHDSLPVGLASHLVIGGDYNVIARAHRPLHPGFLPFEFGLIEDLRARGLADAFESVSPEIQAYSWVDRTGDGYRYDPARRACPFPPDQRARLLAGDPAAEASDHAAHTLSLRANAFG